MADSSSRPDLFDSCRPARLDYALVPSEMTGSTAPILVVGARTLPHADALVGLAVAEFLAREANGLAPERHELLAAPCDGFALGIAHAGRARGYVVHVGVEADARPEIVRAVEALGARLHRVADKAAAIAAARAHAVDPKLVYIERGDTAAIRAYGAAYLGPKIVELVRRLGAEDVGPGHADAFVFGFEGDGFAAAAPTLKTAFPSCRLVAMSGEAAAAQWTQSASTEAPWPLPLDPESIDATATIDDQTAIGYHELLAKRPKILVDEGFTPMEQVDGLVGFFGGVGIRNLFAGVKYARAARFTHENLVVVAVPTDLEHDRSALDAFTATAPKLTFEEAVRRIEWLRETDAGGILEASPALKAHWRKRMR